MGFMLKTKNKKGLCVVILLLLVGGGILFNMLRPRLLPGSELDVTTIAPVSIAAGGSQSLAILEDDTLWVWGASWNEDGTIEPQKEPRLTMENVAAVFAGGSTINMMITTDGTLWTQGTEIRGSRHWLVRFVWMITSLNAPRHREITAIMNNVISVDMVVTGDWSYAMAVTSDGGLWGWGQNRSGQLGTGTTRRSYRRPTRVRGDVISVSATSQQTFIITSDNVLWGWGDNSHGHLGVGITENRQSPVRIMDDVIAISGFHAITSDGILWGWGNNWRGRVGDGTEENRLTPVRIMDNVVAVSAKNSHTMAITEDGTLWGWGLNGNGQLGDGTTEHRNSPIRIMDDVVAVTTGSFHTLAVTSDGTLWAWGSNDAGQLGDGTIEDRHNPVRVMEGVRISN